MGGIRETFEVGGEMAEEGSQTGSSDPALRAQQQRIGSYRILQPLGVGGMSSVFRAVHVETGHEVALKVLTRTLAKNATLLHRFLREARSAESLVHPNIVTIYDRGIDHGRHYLVLEYASGGDLHEYVQRRGPMSVAAAISVVKDVAAGLAYAAGRGLIHRDIKPSNILRTADGRIKIIDLGLALHSEGEDERVTRDGTTVGTVDYMAPEQARDSRATSIQSDIYSLGCTFYYLLTGVPVYPGGDISDKLTRHARAPVPNVNELRPDVSPELAALIQRMLAKEPQDRFASYDELIKFLDEAGKNAETVSPGVALAPLDEPSGPEVSLLFESRGKTLDFSGERGERGGATGGAGDYGLEPGTEVAPDLLEQDEPAISVVEPSRGLAAPLPRVSSVASEDAGAESPEPEPQVPAAPWFKASFAASWLIVALLIGLACVLLGFGLFALWDTSAGPIGQPAVADVPLPEVTPRPRPDLKVAAPAGGGRDASVDRTNGPRARMKIAEPAPSAGSAVVVSPPPARWQEPRDEDLSPPEQVAPSRARSEGWQHLPDWARQAVPERVDGPFVAVSRLTDPGEPATVPTLHLALDRVGGTVELADEGPLYVDDLRFAGESRLIRARPGCRPIVSLEGTAREAVREQDAVFVLGRKNLVLDGIDFVIWVPDLSSSQQKALFSCAGASLTIRNCTFTILNPRCPSFVFIRSESPSSRATSQTVQPTRIRLERTLVRGWFAAGIDVRGGSIDVVLDKSAIVGGTRAFLQISATDPARDARLFALESIIGCTGPMVESTATSPTGRTKTVVVRTFGSTISRMRASGESVASVISCANPAPDAAKQIDWAGDHNLFAGWKGFFACGSDHAVTVPDLAAVRSTWGASERDSSVTDATLPPLEDMSDDTAGEVASRLMAPRALLRQVARPRSGLFEKTVDRYPDPVIPDLRRPPDGGTLAGQPARAARFTRPLQNNGPQPTFQPGVRQAPARQREPREAGELTFETSAARWSGDLGAFLRDQLSEGTQQLRVRVVGSGSHTWTPIRLPRGLRLEIRVDLPPGAAPPSWTPPSQVTGRGLIELEEGSLLLDHVVLRHDGNSGLDHLIHVEDGHLVLSHCQLFAPSAPGDFRGDLIAFRAVSTRPIADSAENPLFSVPVNRPICRLDDTVLITGGTALRAELGRGLVALSQCALASGETAIELVPSEVARARFEADLWLDHCTIASEKTVVGMGRWLGLAPGPDRPWLINSRNCAFVADYERKQKTTTLLRSDPESIVHGAVFWQGHDDAADVDRFATTAEAAEPMTRPRDVQLQWVRFWGHNHMTRISGPRSAGLHQTVRLLERLRPGHVEPSDLILDPEFHPDRERLTVGADLTRVGIVPRLGRYGRRRN
jgi:eukaryotic-like serine/threonine-protein kinase